MDKTTRKTAIRHLRNHVKKEFPELTGSERIEILCDVVVAEIRELIPDWAPTALILAIAWATQKTRKYEQAQTKLLGSGGS